MILKSILKKVEITQKDFLEKVYSCYVNKIISEMSFVSKKNLFLIKLETFDFSQHIHTCVLFLVIWQHSCSVKNKNLFLLNNCTKQYYCLCTMFLWITIRCSTLFPLVSLASISAFSFINIITRSY